jgi:hypothetical protein
MIFFRDAGRNEKLVKFKNYLNFKRFHLFSKIRIVNYNQ